MGKLHKRETGVANPLTTKEVPTDYTPDQNLSETSDVVNRERAALKKKRP